MLPKNRIAHGLVIALALIVAGFAIYQLRILAAPVKVTEVPVAQEAPPPDKKLPVVTLRDLRAPSENFTVPSEAHALMLINIFASWCAPCLAEWPQLMALSREENLTLVGIGLPGDRGLEDFLEENGDPFDRVGLDAKGNVLSLYGASGLPETYLVDGTGRILLQHAGPLKPEDVTTIKNLLLSEKAPLPTKKPDQPKEAAAP